MMLVDILQDRVIDNQHLMQNFNTLLYGGVTLAIDGVINFGDPNISGNWKLYINSDGNLEFDKNSSGTWVSGLVIGV